jgi:hypothetical protein
MTVRLGRVQPLRELLTDIGNLKIDEEEAAGWLFLPRDKQWTLQSPAVLLELNEVPPGTENVEDVATPELAKREKLKWSASTPQREERLTGRSRMLAPFCHRLLGRLPLHPQQRTAAAQGRPNPPNPQRGGSGVSCPARITYRSWSRTQSRKVFPPWHRQPGS